MKKTKRRLTSQPRLVGVQRKGSYVGLIPELEREINRLSLMFHVSRSWVEATLLADQLKIREQPRYYAQIIKTKRRRRHG